MFKLLVLYNELYHVARHGQRSNIIQVGYSVRAGWFGDRIPVGGEIFRTCPDRSWGPPSLLYSGYRVFPVGKAAGAWR